MNEVTVVLVVCVLLAVCVRIFWRLIVNLLVIGAISVIILAIFFVIMGVESLSGAI
jgi:hypothetical protein